MNEKFTPGNWQASFESGNILSEELSYIIGNVRHRIDKEEYEANLQLLTHSKKLYFALLLAKPFIPQDTTIYEDIEKVLRKINPDFDKRDEVTDIQKFAKRVKNMRDWQKSSKEGKEHYVTSNEQLVDSIVAEILQEAQS